MPPVMLPVLIATNPRQTPHWRGDKTPQKGTDVSTKKKKTKSGAGAAGKATTTSKTKRKSKSKRKAKSNPIAAGVQKVARAVKGAARKTKRKGKRNPAPGMAANVGKGLGGVAGGAVAGYGASMLDPMPAAIAGTLVSVAGVAAIAMGHPVAGGVAAGAGGAILGGAVHRYRTASPAPVDPAAEPVAGPEDEELPPGSEIIGRNGELFRINDDGSRTLVRAPRALAYEPPARRTISNLEGSAVHNLD